MKRVRQPPSGSPFCHRWRTLKPSAWRPVSPPRRGYLHSDIPESRSIRYEARPANHLCMMISDCYYRVVFQDRQ